MPESLIHPRFHHLNFKTTRLQEMIDYYSVLVGAEVVFRDDVGACVPSRHSPLTRRSPLKKN